MRFDDGLVLEIIENVDFDGAIFSMAHIAFNLETAVEREKAV